MSFSSECKNELCQIKIRQSDNGLAALSAFVLHAGTLQFGEDIRQVLNSDNMTVIRWADQLIESFYAADTQILMRESAKLGGKRSYSLVVKGKWLRPLLRDCGVIDDTGNKKTEGVPLSLLKTSDNVAHCLRGVFLATGSINDPAKGYHLEMVMHGERQAEKLRGIMEEADISAKVTDRKGHTVVYLKESEKIVAFLALIGAHGAAIRMEEVWVYRDLRNTLNRKVNCETANLEKTASASVRQIANIQWLMEQDAYAALSPQLKEAAHLRMQCPDATLAELGSMASPSVGKSGINHRLRKLEELAESLRKN